MCLFQEYSKRLIKIEKEQRGSIDQYLQFYLILVSGGDRNCRLDP